MRDATALSTGRAGAPGSAGWAGPQSGSLPPGMTSDGWTAQSSALGLIHTPSGSPQASDSPSGAQVGPCRPSSLPVAHCITGIAGGAPFVVYHMMCVSLP